MGCSCSIKFRDEVYKVRRVATVNEITSLLKSATDNNKGTI